MIIVASLLFILSEVAELEAEGTLYLRLERYKNDTCGGFTSAGGDCKYGVQLEIQTSRRRGNAAVTTRNPYKIVDGPRRYPLFTQTQLELLFPRTLYLEGNGTLPNPVPVPTVSGSVNLTLTVHNEIDRIFSKTYTLQTGEMSPSSTLRHPDVLHQGFFIFTTWLHCSPGYTGLGCKGCAAGWYGPKCGEYCVAGEKWTCDPDTGNRICVHPAVGPHCNITSSCPESRYGGECTVECISEPGRLHCDEQGASVCEDPFEGPDCTACTPGWTGEMCTKCGEGWYGDDCGVYCGGPSHNYICSPLGEKTCLGHWAGKDCNTCKEGQFGPSCNVNCTEGLFYGNTCNKRTGKVVCVSTRRGAHCEECVPEHFPQPHRPECVRCVETHRYSCSPAGAMRCKQGWFGRECHIQCVDTQQYRCQRNGTDSVYKRCSGHWAGEECEECVEHHYGPQCTVYCVPDERSTCDAQGNRKCGRDYYNPPSCGRYCNSSSPLYSCTQHGFKHCIGFRNVSTGCKDCITGYYGPHCSVSCQPSGRIPNTRCNARGELECARGWDGHDCQQCAENWYGSGTCHVQCVHGNHYACNAEGVLELRSEYDESTDEAYAKNMTFIIGGFVALYFVCFYGFCKTAHLWCPVVVRKRRK